MANDTTKGRRVTHVAGFLASIGSAILVLASCSPSHPSMGWYVERGCVGCDKALAAAVKYAEQKADGGGRPIVACPDRDGWAVIFTVSNEDYCRAVIVTAKGEVGYAHKDAICEEWQKSLECSPVKWRSKDAR